MNELEFQEEWLSAYLDDELTDEQRLVVEQRLAIDPAAQAMLEDLQRVRTMVAKLPSWSSQDLKFAIPTGLPGSFDEADDELADDSDDELEDFEEVPRLIAGIEEPRVSKPTNPNWNSNSRSMYSMLGWIATAATVLIAAGLGYVFWPPAGLQVANLESKQAPSAATGSQVDNLERENLSRNREDVLSSPAEFGSVMGGQGKDDSETSLPARIDPASLAKKSNSIQQSDAFGIEAKTQFGDDANDLKMRAVVEPNQNTPSIMPSDAPGGLAGARSAAELALNRLPENAPAVASLPLPSPMKAEIESAEPSDVASANGGMGAKTEGYVVLAPTVFYARSQSWMDEETQSTLGTGAQQYRADQIVFGNNALQQGAEQKRGAVAAESVLMAGIKPEVANSPEFFPSIVASNRLVEVEQRPLLSRFSVTDLAQNANSLANGRLDRSGNAAPVTDSANAPASNMFSHQRQQMVAPNQAQINSFILFLNRTEANQILNQLQEKGQVSSQVWTVAKQSETQNSLATEINSPSAAATENAASQRTSGETQKQKGQAISNNKVILMLNGSPN